MSATGRPAGSGARTPSEGIPVTVHECLTAGLQQARPMSARVGRRGRTVQA